MRNGADEDHKVNSALENGSDEWHGIADTVLEEIAASAITKHCPDHSLFTAATQ